MKPQLILHIPHSSTEIPLYQDYTVSTEVLEAQIVKLTDWYTDDLFQAKDAVRVQAEFSRLFCDVERFPKDEQEVMAKFGMGVIYEKGENGETIRVIKSDTRELILKDYYWPHHRKLAKAVDNQVLLFGRALILDCHSFPSVPHKSALNQRRDRPDFNIGTDPFHTPQRIVDFASSFFESAHYSLGIDWPYSGSIVPLKEHKKNKQVSSVMLEVNRRLYMNETTLEKSEKYEEIKSIVGDFINQLELFCQDDGC